MAIIKVDYSKFKEVSSAVNNYVVLTKNKMRGVKEEVTALSASWQGVDFTQFKTEFDKVDDEDSTYTQMVKAMESYAKYFEFAVNKYKVVQANAINRANTLCK